MTTARTTPDLAPGDAPPKPRIITLGNNALHPVSRALLWPRGRTLFIADAHLGKAATFRKVGIPVPEAVAEQDLTELAELCDTALAGGPVSRLVILGDLIHARRGRGPELEQQVRAWLDARPTLRVVLVRGNHDRAAGDPPAAWGMTVIPEGTPDADAGGPADSPFILRHDPAPDDRGPVLAGHVHPAVRLRDFGYRTVRVPCFHLAGLAAAAEGPGACLTLPAWTRFAGVHCLRPAPDHRCWPVLEGRVSPSFGGRS